MVVEDYRLEYNRRRPHGSLGYLSPGGVCGRLHQDERMLGPLPRSLSFFPAPESTAEKCRHT
jgi:hypothetical protein